MANKDNLSVSGDVTPIGKGTKVDVDVKNQSENLGGQVGIFADSYGGKGGRLTGVYKKESTKFERTIQGENFRNIAAKINVQHEGEKWREHAAISGDNNGSRGRQVHGNYINGNTEFGAQVMGCNNGNIYNEPVHSLFNAFGSQTLNVEHSKVTDAFPNHSRGNIYNEPVHSLFNAFRSQTLNVELSKVTDAFPNHSRDSCNFNLKGVVDDKPPVARVPHMPPPPPDPPNPNI